MTDKHVFAFGKDTNGNNVTEGDKTMNYVLGGKGANLAEMANIGLPVPPGFTISCQTCVAYAENGAFPDGVLDEIQSYREDLESRLGKKIGDPIDPLLVSVRSGAPFSMPGMMDTVLNLGMNDESVNGLAAQTGNPRFAWDSYRRFIQMFSNVVMGIDGDEFENAITAMKALHNVQQDTELTTDDLKELVSQFKQIFAENVDAVEHPEVAENGVAEFPQNPDTQLLLAIKAVFGSWNNERAIIYRKQNKIPDDLGTAVNVQTMVFGNKGETSATGVAFTRDAATGKKVFYGDFLVNAQGEDVVAGIRNTSPISELKTTPGLEQAGQELEDIFVLLEDHYRDMMDIEFTIEQGKLYMLQTRVGKRTAAAALRIAIEMVDEGMIDKETAVKRVAPNQLDQLLHSQISKNAVKDIIATGLNASPGAAVGEAVFSAADAVAAAEAGRKTVLVRWETTPDDLAGMITAEGILTSHGGKTSHAAVIARGMGAPCVCGVEALRIDAASKTATVAGTDIVIKEGDIISIDGTTGEVMLGAVELVEPEMTGDLGTLLGWADEVRRLGVRANADNPEDAKLAREMGAEGIGLCRTEHMFLGDRKQIVTDMILAEKGSDEYNEALDRLYDLQQSDYYGILKAMDGLPVIIRLLDPPLHEFLPDREGLVCADAVRKALGQGTEPSDEMLLEAVKGISEMNPMLGLRGCRLGITMPGLSAMQARAIAKACAQLVKENLTPRPEVMVPLVSMESELKYVRTEIENAIAQVESEEGVDLSFIEIGTMIELPRAAVTADEIARQADFFSFGTNDLTQTTFGFSRDDVEGKFFKDYEDLGIMKVNPFATVDDGVVKLIGMAVSAGKEQKPDMMMGVCGEHGGDPDSIMKFDKVGLDYVSCSPYRVPVARLAAAHAVLGA